MTACTRWLAVIVIMTATTLAASVPAGAGTATVYQCTGPGGQVVSTDLVTSSVAWASTLRNCGSPYWPWGLMLDTPGTPGTSRLAGQYGEALVNAPPATLITGGTLTRQMLNYHYEGGKVGSSYGFGYSLRTADGQAIDICGGAAPQAPDNCLPQPDGLARFTNPVRDISRTRGPVPQPVVTPTLRIAVGCFLGRSSEGGGGLCYLYTGREALGISQMALRVAETEAPAIRSVSGSLVSDAPVRARGIAINASDAGLGLFRLLVYVDGALTEAQPFDASSPACADLNPATADPYELPGGYVCPTGSTSRGFSLASLPADGQHEIRVLVEDAAGNATVALQRTVTFALPANGLRCPADGCVVPRPAPNGINATSDAKLSVTTKGRTQRRIGYGQRAAIVGTVTTSTGVPIIDATIDVYSLVDVPGAVWQAAGSARTDARGRFRYSVRVGPTRTFRFAYRTHVGDAEPTRTAGVRIGVRAGVSAKARPNQVPPGGRVRVTGRLRGAAVPASGANVELQALDGREWRTFKTLAVHRGGRFSYRYRFRHTTRDARFLWRVYVRKQAALPYAAAASRPFWVVVQP
ncbi:MAG TPA: hypothetical protein VNS09_01420 [Solirubrobacter sp.]|nr:hypothetical protein [Solirubrobacter sp.]